MAASAAGSSVNSTGSAQAQETCNTACFSYDNFALSGRGWCYCGNNDGENYDAFGEMPPAPLWQMRLGSGNCILPVPKNTRIGVFLHVFDNVREVWAHV